MAATTISDPTIGAASNAGPFSNTAGHAGRKQDAADDMQPALDPGEQHGSCRRHQPVVQAEQEQQHAADEIEMGMRRPQREVVLDTHGDAREHSEQQDENADAHHQ
ncbi:hypothetical protein [Bradyrhizobium sp. USDA 4350]